MKPAIFLILCVALVVMPTVVFSQRAAAYPHGDMSADISCGDCHISGAARPVMDSVDFDHGGITGFSLTGRHTSVGCNNCHFDFNFSEPKLTDGVCTTCHFDVHRGRLSPDCESCHNTTLFAIVDGLDLHARTSFPLSGAHQQLSCESCHPNDAGGAYTTQPTDCVACHQSDYDGVHASTGFPTTCILCHTNVTWADANFADHDSFYFPIFSGEHQGRWAGCENCHINANDFSQFTCFNCHEHRQSEMDDIHRDRPGYIYESAACYSCHPTGRSP